MSHVDSQSIVLASVTTNSFIFILKNWLTHNYNLFNPLTYINLHVDIFYNLWFLDYMYHATNRKLNGIISKFTMYASDIRNVQC